MDKKKDTKETVQDLLVKQLTIITDEVVKNLGNKDDDLSPAELEKKKAEDAEKAKLEKKAEDAEKAKLEKKADVEDDKVTKQLDDLSVLVKSMSNKLEKMENPDADLIKKKDEIIAKATELAAEMGIDSDDLDIEFKVMEKKKGNADTNDDSQDEFAKKQGQESSDLDYEDELEKEMAGANDEERKGALGKYLRGVMNN